MSLREDNEKRDSQLRKEADLFRTGYLAGLNAAIEAVREAIPEDAVFSQSDRAVHAIQALKEGGGSNE